MRDENGKHYVDHFDEIIMIKIAVLMSTYNGEKYLREQIISILNQVGEFSLDLIVRDDGSKDNTINILREFEAQKKLTWYTGDNLKSARSFVHLLKNCSEHDYYAFADQDDFWECDKIQRGINELKKQVVPALYCSNAELVDCKLKSFGRNVYKVHPKTDFETVVCAGGLLGCTMIFNKKLAEIVKNNDKYPHMILHDFYLAVLCVSVGGNIIYDPNATMKYRQHDNNVVGISYGIKGIILGRIKDILYKEPISIAKQAEGIVQDYSCYLSKERIEWLIKVSKYKKSIISRGALAFTRKTKYINKNMSIKLRLSILLGNR